MHEIAICQSIIDEAKKQGATKSVVVEVGELADLSAEEVDETLKRLDSKLDPQVEYKESLVKCACGYEGKANILDKGHGFCYYNCPKCSGKPQILEGGGIKIIGVE